MTVQVHGHIEDKRLVDLAQYVAKHLPERLKSRIGFRGPDKSTIRDISIYVSPLDTDFEGIVNRIAWDINRDIDISTDDHKMARVGFAWFIGRAGSHVVADDKDTGISVRASTPHGVTELIKVCYWIYEEERGMGSRDDGTF